MPIPELQHRKLNHIDWTSEDVLGNLYCVRRVSKPELTSNCDFKEFAFKLSDVKSLLSNNAVSFDDSIRTRIFGENKIVLLEKVSRRLSGMQMQYIQDRAEFQERDVAHFQADKEERRFSPCFAILVSWVKNEEEKYEISRSQLDIAMKEANQYLQQIGALGHDEQIDDLNKFYNKVKACFFELFWILHRRTQALQTSNHSAYMIRRRRFENERGFLNHILFSDEMQAKAIGCRPIYKEDLLLLAMREQPCRNEILSAVGEYDCVHLVMLSTEAGCKSCLDQADALSQELASILNSGRERSVCVKVWNFVGRFQPHASDEHEATEPSSFIPPRAWLDFVGKAPSPFLDAAVVLPTWKRIQSLQGQETSTSSTQSSTPYYPMSQSLYSISSNNTNDLVSASAACGPSSVKSTDPGTCEPNCSEEGPSGHDIDEVARQDSAGLTSTTRTLDCALLGRPRSAGGRDTHAPPGGPNVSVLADPNVPFGRQTCFAPLVSVYSLQRQPCQTLLIAVQCLADQMALLC